MKTKVWNYDSFPFISENGFKIIIIFTCFVISFIYFLKTNIYSNNFVSTWKKKIGKNKRLINGKQITIIKLIIFDVMNKINNHFKNQLFSSLKYWYNGM